MKIEKSIKENRNDKLMLISGITGLSTILIFACFAINRYFQTFNDNQGYSKSQEVWGQFGDFLGGVLNPAIGGLTVYLLLVSVYMQRRELRNSLNEMQKSNESLVRQDIRQTFFTWLDSYREIVGGTAGRNHLKKTFDNYIDAKKLDNIMNSYYGYVEGQKVISEFRRHGSARVEVREEMRSEALELWEELYNAEAHHIGSMFRTLYRLIKWLDEQDENILSAKQKYEYISIVRAQLSDIEVDYLFFNGLTRRGSAFVKLINKYALFNNIFKKEKPVITMMDDPLDGKFNYSAYNSTLAKSNLGINTDLSDTSSGP